MSQQKIGQEMCDRNQHSIKEKVSQKENSPNISTQALLFLLLLLQSEKNKQEMYRNK